MGKRAATKVEAGDSPAAKAPNLSGDAVIQTPPGCGPPIPGEALNVNGAHYAQVVAALEKIRMLRHKGRFLPLCTPLSIADGGRINPYDSDQFAQCIANSLDYTCGATIFAASVHDMISPGVPILVSHVQQYMEHRFSDVRNLVPPTVVIAVDEGQDPMQCRGGLCRVTAAEPIHALLYPSVFMIMIPNENTSNWIRVQGT